SPQFAQQIEDETRYGGDSTFRLAMVGPYGLEYQEKDGFHIAPLLYTDKQLSWNRVTPISDDSLQMKVPKLPTDESGSFITAVRMNRNIHNRDQRIIVASDADYITNPQLNARNHPARYNFLFDFWSFSYLTIGQFPAYTLHPKSLDNAFKITDNNI